MTCLSCYHSMPYLFLNMKLFSISLQLDIILIISFFGREREPSRIQNMFLVQAVNKAPVNKAPFNILLINEGKGASFPSCYKLHSPHLLRLIMCLIFFQLQIGLGGSGACILLPPFHNLRKYLSMAELTVSAYKYSVKRHKPLHIHILWILGIGNTQHCSSLALNEVMIILIKERISLLSQN